MRPPPVRSVKGSIRVGVWPGRKRSPRGAPYAGTVKPHWPRTVPPMAPMTCAPTGPSRGEVGARLVIRLPGGRGTAERCAQAALAGVPVRR